MNSDVAGALEVYRSAVIRACKASIDAAACRTRMDHIRADAAGQQEDERRALLVAEIERLEKLAERGAYLEGALARLMGGAK